MGELSLKGRLIGLPGLDSSANSAKAQCNVMSNDETLLTIRDAAELLGKSTSWVYKNYRTLGIAYEQIGGEIRFTRASLEEYRARHTVRGNTGKRGASPNQTASYPGQSRSGGQAPFSLNPTAIPHSPAARSAQQVQSLVRDIEQDVAKHGKLTRDNARRVLVELCQWTSDEAEFRLTAYHTDCENAFRSGRRPNSAKLIQEMDWSYAVGFYFYSEKSTVDRSSFEIVLVGFPVDTMQERILPSLREISPFDFEAAHQAAKRLNRSEQSLRIAFENSLKPKDLLDAANARRDPSIEASKEYLWQIHKSCPSTKKAMTEIKLDDKFPLDVIIQETISPAKRDCEPSKSSPSDEYQRPWGCLGLKTKAALIEGIWRWFEPSQANRIILEDVMTAREVARLYCIKKLYHKI